MNWKKILEEIFTIREKKSLTLLEKEQNNFFTISMEDEEDLGV